MEGTQDEVLPAAVAKVDLGVMVSGVVLDAEVLADTALEEAADPLAMARVPCVVAAVDAWADLDTGVVEGDFAALVLGAEAAPAAVTEQVAVPVAEAVDLSDRMGSSAVAAFVGFGDRQACCRPSCCRQREVGAQGLAEGGSASAHPIVALVDLLQEHQVGRLVGEHLVEAVRRLGWADRSLAVP